MNALTKANLLLCATVSTLIAVLPALGDDNQQSGAGLQEPPGQAIRSRTAPGMSQDQINGTHREAFRQRMLERFDANHDGTLDADEKAKMDAFLKQRREERQARKAEGDARPLQQALTGERNSDQGNAAGGGGGRQLSAKLIQRFDKDGDGKLNDSEMAAARAFLKERRAQRMSQSGGNGGGGANTQQSEGEDSK